ncbi:MAG: hypothetical protein J6I84_04545 [Bacilli bacterium]|nr:hypothetical protein [Bacilli bacterium]
MGCFNTTGFLSRLPILAGQRVACFIGIETHRGFRELYYPDSVIAPYFLPVYGKYDDYGAVGNIDSGPVVDALENYFGVGIEEILKSVERCLYGKGLQDNIKYWEGKDKDTYTRILPITNRLRNQNPTLSLMMEHESIYLEFTKTKEDLLSGFRDIIKEWKNHRNLKLPKFFGKGVGDGIWLPEKCQEIIKSKKYGIYSHEGMSEYFMALFKQLPADKEIEVFEKADYEINRFLTLYTKLLRMPDYFHPSKTGDQDYNLDTHRDLAELILDSINELYTE